MKESPLYANKGKVLLDAYRQHLEERKAEGIVPKPLSAEQVNQLVELLKSPPEGDENFILDLIENRVPAGVDDAAYIKAAFLTALGMPVGPPEPSM